MLWLIDGYSTVCHSVLSLFGKTQAGFFQFYKEKNAFTNRSAAPGESMPRVRKASPPGWIQAGITILQVDCCY